jgi:predicted  nucleic acid-binding Zn-ribbon protein
VLWPAMSDSGLSSRALEVTMGTMNWRAILQPGFQERIIQELERIATAQASSNENAQLLASKSHELTQLDAEIELAKRNLSRARSEEQYEAVSGEFERLTARRKTLQIQLGELREKCDRPSDVASELDAAIGLMKRLGVVAASNGDHSAARELYEGRTGRVALQSNLKQEISPSHRESTGNNADEKEISLGNASRGDRI